MESAGGGGRRGAALGLSSATTRRPPCQPPLDGGWRATAGQTARFAPPSSVWRPPLTGAPCCGLLPRRPRADRRSWPSPAPPRPGRVQGTRPSPQAAPAAAARRTRTSKPPPPSPNHGLHAPCTPPLSADPCALNPPSPCSPEYIRSDNGGSGDSSNDDSGRPRLKKGRGRRGGGTSDTRSHGRQSGQESAAVSFCAAAVLLMCSTVRPLRQSANEWVPTYRGARPTLPCPGHRPR